MATVAKIVADIIRNRPFIEEALVSEIINYAYLADMLKPEVERQLRKPTNRYAIIMALRRLKDDLKEGFVGPGALDLRNADITITSGIFETTIEKDSESTKRLAELYSLVDLSKGDFITITYGLYEITIISNTKYRKKIEGILSGAKTVKTTTGLSSLVVRVPLEVADAIGLLYSLTKALSWEGISIVEVVSTLTEEIFIINEADTAAAFSALSRLIGKA